MISPWKNLELVPLVARRVDAHFVIVGSLYDMASYRRVLNLVKQYDIKDKVTIFTDVSLAVKVELLRKAKVYFHTQRYEPFGISIVEGMAAGGVPVVHDSGGPQEFVPPQWRYRDTEDAVQKIEEALKTSPNVSEKMREIAYEYREESFQRVFDCTRRLSRKQRYLRKELEYSSEKTVERCTLRVMILPSLLRGLTRHAHAKDETLLESKTLYQRACEL